MEKRRVKLKKVKSWSTLKNLKGGNKNRIKKRAPISWEKLQKIAPNFWKGNPNPVCEGFQTQHPNFFKKIRP